MAILFGGGGCFCFANMSVVYLHPYNKELCYSAPPLSRQSCFLSSRTTVIKRNIIPKYQGQFKVKISLSHLASANELERHCISKTPDILPSIWLSTERALLYWGGWKQRFLDLISTAPLATNSTRSTFLKFHPLLSFLPSACWGNISLTFY